jgi:glycosyltransferase involved in cell wall biosynthesis
MASFNGSKYIGEQIKSILVQLDDADELVISDDCSTDETEDIIKRFNDKRIRYIKHKKEIYKYNMPSASFRMAALNFENALKNANGDIIFLSDQDDVWKAGKVKKVSELLNEYDLVMSNMSIIDIEGNILKERYYMKKPLSELFIINLLKSKFLGCCMAFKKEVLSYCLPFPKNIVAHDYWIGCMVSFKGEVKYCEEPLILYRRGSGNISTATGKSNNCLAYRFKYRYDVLRQTIKRVKEMRKRERQYL